MHLWSTAKLWVARNSLIKRTKTDKTKHSVAVKESGKRSSWTHS